MEIIENDVVGGRGSARVLAILGVLKCYLSGDAQF